MAMTREDAIRAARMMEQSARDVLATGRTGRFESHGRAYRLMSRRPDTLVCDVGSEWRVYLPGTPTPLCVRLTDAALLI